ncbi:hypothetical protein ACN47E_002433 [Coniothyrium glycines]
MPQAPKPKRKRGSRKNRGIRPGKRARDLAKLVAKGMALAAKREKDAEEEESEDTVLQSIETAHLEYQEEPCDVELEESRHAYYLELSNLQIEQDAAEREAEREVTWSLTPEPVSQVRASDKEAQHARVVDGGASRTAPTKRS